MHVVPLAPSVPLAASDGWGDRPTLALPRSPIERPLAAIRRYKWLILGVIALSSVGGVIATRLVKPDYEVTAKIWVQALAASSVEGPDRKSVV